MTVVGLLFAAGTTTPAWSEEAVPSAPTPDRSRPAAPPAPQGIKQGFKAFVDPATGQFTVPPPRPVPESPATSPAPTTPLASGTTGPSANLATSHEGLTAVRGTTRAGGLMVDLKGRFQSSLVATVGPDGKVRTECVVTAATKQADVHGQ